MVTFQINSTDIGAIEQLLNIAKEQFNLQIKVIDGLTKPQKKRPNGASSLERWMVFLLLKSLTILKRVVKRLERTLSLGLETKIQLWVELIF